MEQIERLKPFIGGAFIESSANQYMDVFDPSTGKVIAQTPCCTKDEVAAAIHAANEAFPLWRDTPVIKRVQVLYKLRELLIRHRKELTYCVAHENGKVWAEAEGDVLKAQEGTELACSAPSLMMGESIMDAASNVDAVLYREPMGVFAGIAPFNFPAMIPMGWMAPMCIATGNTMVIKASSATPMTALRIAALYQEAGLPDGVLNVLTCSRNESELFLRHPDVRGVTLVGSTAVGAHVYAEAAKNGKRVQCLTEAKNHALVLKDAPIERTAAGIVNSAFGCAGERCMALPVIVAQEEIADKLVAKIVELCRNREIGPAWDKTSKLGPMISKPHMDGVLKWIEKGVQEGAEIVLDGRGLKIAGYEEGFYLGHTILDHVTPEMTSGIREIFGPVLLVKRVKTFEEGLALMNEIPYANGSVIYTQNGYYARMFSKYTHGGMVGVNVGIPVPVGMFPFCGHKQSFFGDLHCLGKDGVRFFTESKTVTTRWFDEEEAKITQVSTWDGTI